MVPMSLKPLPVGTSPWVLAFDDVADRFGVEVLALSSISGERHSVVAALCAGVRCAEVVGAERRAAGHVVSGRSKFRIALSGAWSQIRYDGVRAYIPPEKLAEALTALIARAQERAPSVREPREEATRLTLL